MRASTLTMAAILFFILFAVSHGGERFRLQASGEGGAFYTNDYADNSIMRFIGNLHYSKTFSQSYFQLKMRLAPEMYDEDPSKSVFKSKTVLTFGGRNDTALAWQFEMSHRYYYYNLGQSGNLQYNILYLSGQTSWPRKKRASWLAQFSYFYRDISAQPYTRLDSYSAQGGIGGRFRHWIFYQLKLYAEAFTIRAATDFMGKAQNKGTRIGPLISVHYSNDYIFNASYLLVLEDNQLNKKLMIEHSVRLVAGKYLSDRLSLFVYAKYFIRSSSEEVVPEQLTYTPLDSENWFYAKVGYDIIKNSEIFLRFGYVNDTLPGRKEHLSGWQVLAGIHYLFRRE